MRNAKYYSVGPLLILVLTALLLIQCGGGGSDSSTTVTAPTQNIIGSYSLKAFTLKYSNGITITEKEMPVSGTMKIGANTISQVMVINNNPISFSGSYSIMYTNGTSAGTFSITEASGTQYLQFWISGNDLTTYSGEMRLNATITYEEWDTWTKAADVLSSVKLLHKEQKSQSDYIWIGNF